MGKFDKLKLQPKTVVIGGEEFTLKPIPNKKLEKLIIEAKNNGSDLTPKDLIIHTIKESYPDEEFNIDDVSIGFIEQLAKAVLEVNNLTPREG